MSLNRILYISGGILNRGGIEAFMMNNYRRFDHSKLQIDFVVHGSNRGYYDDEIQQLGGKIFYVPVKTKDFKGNVDALKKIFKSGTYQIVHSHMDAMSYVPLKLAEESGIPYRIAHSHNTNFLTSNPIKILLNKYAQRRLPKYATHYMACSTLAGKWLFGKRMVNDGKVALLNNAIELSKFEYNPHFRDDKRKEFGLENSFVIGHVGRFDYQKNHKFLIDIFNEFIKIPRSDARLVLVGEGFLQKEIQDKVKELLIQDKVLFLGSRSDVSELLNIFDVFMFPSLFEGLPVCLIEAQANGLSILASDTISPEVNLTGQVQFKSIDQTNVWVNSLMEAKRLTDNTSTQILTDKGYNIEIEAKKLQNFYLDLLSKTNL